MVHLCTNPDCNLPIHHKGKHSFIYKKAWEANVIKLGFENN